MKKEKKNLFWSSSSSCCWKRNFVVVTWQGGFISLFFPFFFGGASYSSWFAPESTKGSAPFGRPLCDALCVHSKDNMADVTILRRCLLLHRRSPIVFDSFRFLSFSLDFFSLSFMISQTPNYDCYYIPIMKERETRQTKKNQKTKENKWRHSLHRNHLLKKSIYVYAPVSLPKSTFNKFQKGKNSYCVLPTFSVTPFPWAPVMIIEIWFSYFFHL